MYKKNKGRLEIFLVHPGGPFWKDKDFGAWSIPKGEIDNDNEEMLDVALRELNEETGVNVDKNKTDFLDLGEIKQKAGKIVHAFAFEGDWNGFFMKQSMIEIEWPPKSNKKLKIPEVDKAKFFNIETAKQKINLAQVELIDRLIGRLSN